MHNAHILNKEGSHKADRYIEDVKDGRPGWLCLDDSGNRWCLHLKV